jgi:hypothetical protein
MKGTGFDCPNRAIVERIAKINGSVLFMISSRLLKVVKMPR